MRGTCSSSPAAATRIARRERELIGSFRDRRVDGIIVVPASHDHTYLYDEQRAGTALVFVDRPAGHLDADSVVSNNVGGSVEAVEHLLAHGHRRIAFLGDLLSISTADDRLEGYTPGARAGRDRTTATLIRTGLRDPEAAARAVDELLALPDPPTALFTSQNLLTIGGIRALRRAGLERRIALIGFDDVALADILEPAISVVAQDPQAIGRSAAELLFRRLDGDTSPSVHHVVPVKLIARGSGEIHRPARPVIVVGGEALVDLVDEHGVLSPVPGGGPFNTAIALGRLGDPGRVSRHAVARRLRGPARPAAGRGRRRHVARPLVRCPDTARGRPSA